MRRAPFAAVLLLLAAPLAAAPAQAPRVELDHVYIVVTPGGEAEIAALRSAGFTVPAEPPRRHEGQGTASLAVYFDNAYLELIWVDSTVPAEPRHASTTQWFRAAAAWRSNGHSPFGLGVRRMAGDTAPLPVPVEREAADWLGPDAFYELLHQPADSLAADFFVVPAISAVPRWIARAKQREPTLWMHPGGGRMVTMVRVHGPPQQLPRALHVLRPVHLDSRDAPAPLLELEIDRGLRGERVDLRPLLPLVIIR